jgi:hypothetical protein
MVSSDALSILCDWKTGNTAYFVGSAQSVKRLHICVGVEIQFSHELGIKLWVRWK